MTPWRAHYAAALYATGVPPSLIALALGDFVRPISRQRVYQLLDKAGLEWRHRASVADNADIDAAIRAAQAAGLVRRGDIISRVRETLPATGRAHISARITALSGRGVGTRYIPPPGTPAEWRYCIKCEAFAPPSSRYGHCKPCYNALMRVRGAEWRASRGWRVVGQHEPARARARAAIDAYRRGEYPSILAACKACGATRGLAYRLIKREATP